MTWELSFVTLVQTANCLCVCVSYFGLFMASSFCGQIRDNKFLLAHAAVLYKNHILPGVIYFSRRVDSGVLIVRWAAQALPVTKPVLSRSHSFFRLFGNWTLRVWQFSFKEGWKLESPKETLFHFFFLLRKLELGKKKNKRNKWGRYWEICGGRTRSEPELVHRFFLSWFFFCVCVCRGVSLSYFFRFKRIHWLFGILLRVYTRERWAARNTAPDFDSIADPGRSMVGDDPIPHSLPPLFHDFV